MPVTLLKFTGGPWELARHNLKDDLDRIELELNQPVDLTESTGTISVTSMPRIPAGVLLGRGSLSGFGPAEAITLGPGLEMNGTVLSVIDRGDSAIGVGETGGDADSDRHGVGGSDNPIPYFTTGSVIFAGPGGILFEDNAKFFWDDTNFRLGIGTATPGSPLEVRKDALAAVETDGATLLNGTAATSGVLVQMPPRLKFSGTAWNGASSDTITAFWELLPQSGTTRGQIKLGMERNAGSTFYPVTIDGNPTTALANLTIAGNGAFRSGGNGTAASPTFGWVNTGGGSAIGFYTPAANDMNLVCGAANQILWGVSLWRNSSVMPMCWSSNADPNLAVGDTAMIRKAAAKITFYNKPEGTPDAGFVLDFSTDAIAVFRNRADSAYATIDCLGLKASGVAGANATLSGVTAISITVVNGIVTVCTSP